MVEMEVVGEVCTIFVESFYKSTVSWSSKIVFYFFYHLQQKI